MNMSNKKKKPAASNPVAGKNNLNKKSEKLRAADKKSAQKKAVAEEKEARKVIEKSVKNQNEKKKKSEEIRKRREKQKITEKKLAQKEQNKSEKAKKRKSLKKKLKKFFKKIKYYTSKEFLQSFNYVRILLFIVLPIVILSVGCVAVFSSTFFNVPGEIRNFEYVGRAESENTAKISEFNNVQKQALIDATEAKGSGKFDFYISKTIYIDDDFSTSDLCLGNPNDDCVIVATIYDSHGDVLYRSLGIEPGREISAASLFDEISYGEHKLKVCVNAYDGNSLEKIGTKYAKITLAVGVKADE